EPTKIRAQILKNLNAGFEEQQWPSPFYEHIVQDRASAPAWPSLDPANGAAWLTHQLLRKNASPGRVHRFWRTARAFFSEALEEFRSLVSEPSGNRTRRLKLELSHSGSASNCRKDEVYSGRLPFAPDAPFEILCCANHFVTVCNLARVLGPDGDPQKLADAKEFEASDDDGNRHKFTIASVCPMDGVLASYQPLIVLEENPERFRVLV